MTVDIEKLEALAEDAIDQAKRWKDAGEPWPIWNKCLLEMQAATNPAAVLEMTQTIRDLQSSVQGLNTGYEAYERVNAELRAERKALRKDASLHSQLQRAAEVLPGAWSVEIVVEHHAGWIDVFDDGGNKVMFDGEGHLADQVSDAIDLALTLSKEDSQ
ncbi:hypothetical protein [Pseudomonas syringae]|uniref:Uncharacterized protein n=1 Tax=Pseudomonas syringae pv. papulans TaxID=83963 RepID=A0A0P9Y668_PSESX|nr:hypothetical protein [Pseudomonas syringae]KPY33134.1 putative prophage PSSB64-02, Orf37 [Pseudomonas syringae pv. papulans]KWS33170.1 hypothetical protein AL059_12150 [Pseudomonas syringae pv. papulans]MDH4604596.1 hypothetical protein [Pseudomonas syringae pv. papulans]MDH4623799.1 hypothetical protein [Pseudomonas syringae pv. papulans]RMN47963.1 putative prophage PSSB64-02, Orf37 [Pseudomonas syringae pv. papulans]